MKKRVLLISVSTTLLLGGCAGMGKEDRIGKNDRSDTCYVHLDRLDDIAIYYKDQRMTDIAAGVAIGAGTGVLAGAATGGSTVALIAGGLTGAIAGGFAADAYWKNKMQQANNQMELAIGAIEKDMSQDVEKLSSVDKDIANLIRCRTERRDMIKKQFAERKITLIEAQRQWKEWGDLLLKDQQELKYLNEALDSVKKVEDSYDFATNAIDSASPITEDVQRKWQDELNSEKNKALALLEDDYRLKMLSKKMKSKEKAKLNKEHKKKVAETNAQFASKASALKDKKTSPKSDKLKLLAASVHEKHESIRKSKDQVDNLSAEASKNNGFEEIRSMLFLPTYSEVSVFLNEKIVCSQQKM
jgi:hypothetical protein